jgi:hypothetical protein
MASFAGSDGGGVFEQAERYGSDEVDEVHKVDDVDSSSSNRALDGVIRQFLAYLQQLLHHRSNGLDRQGESSAEETSAISTIMLLSLNRSCFLKTMLFRQDERLLFIIRRYFVSKSMSEDAFLTELLELSARESANMFDQLFINCSLEVGKKLSNDERKERGTKATSLTYGEIDYKSFITILRKCCCGFDTREKIFIDLGSGTGRAVFAARINEDFASCEGIELLEGLQEASEQVAVRFEACFQKFLHYKSSNKVKLTKGSITELDWSHGDFVFANSTCFGADLMAKVSGQAEKLKAGSILVSFTNPLNSEYFELLEKTKYSMSWGPATVYVHRRLPEGVTVSSRTFDASKCRPLNCWKSFLDSVKQPTTNIQTNMHTSHSTPVKSGSGDHMISPTKPLSPSSRRAHIINEQEAILTSPHRTASDSLHAALPSSLSPGKLNEFTFYKPPTAAEGKDAPSSAFTFKKSVSQMKLLLWAPESYSSETYDQRSLVVFLHGATARGSNFDEMLKFALPEYLSSQTTPASSPSSPSSAKNSNVANMLKRSLVLCPLCPSGVEWKAGHICDILTEMIDQVVLNFSVDARRIYVTGISMGGLGAYMLAARNPQKFAAISPICGGGSPVYARLLKHLPWYLTLIP